MSATTSLKQIQTWKALKACHRSFDQISVTAASDAIYIAASSVLYRYEIGSDKWREYMRFTANPHATICIDEERSILYMFGENGHIYTLDLKHKSYTKSSESFFDASHARSLLIHGEFHVFGGWNDANNAHYVWHPNTQTLQQMHRFTEINCNNNNDDGDDGGEYPRHYASQFSHGLHNHWIAYLRDKQCVLISAHHSKQIYAYSLNTHQCAMLPFRLQTERGMLTHLICSSDGKYLIHFTASGDQTIWLYDLQTFVTLRSRVKCPSQVLNAAVIANNGAYTAEVVTCGFVRNCWKLARFANVRFPETVLIHVIQSYVKQKLIHCMNENTHLCIDEDVILRNTDLRIRTCSVNENN